MKKLLTLLLTLLMVFTLVGCNSKEDTPVVQEPEKQEEVVEQTKEEPEIVGGYVDVEDGTLTDELKDIFNKALEGLLGATYEPQELVATQVVAGTNYKFLASGTKTTNPVTKGTYYIYVNKDLQGTISLLDIEVISETKEEAKTQDVTQMSFWVVFYDQYGNELQREALKYGTVPEYKSWLPEGFDKWVYKKSQKDVGTLKAITGNTYYQAVCHEVYHSSSDPTPEPTPTVTNYTVSFNLNGSTGTPPDSQTIVNGSLVTKPDDPTYANHTFAGWYKTKDQNTGILSDLWNFDTDVVTVDTTLYAKWTRKIIDIIPIDFPMYTSEVPANAWISDENQSIKIYARDNFWYNILYAKNVSEEMQILNYGGVTSDDVEKIENTYIYNNALSKIKVIFKMTDDDKLESIEIKAHDDAGQNIKDACGTYKAPSSSPVLCSNTDDLYYIYGEPFGPVLGGDMADSYIFKYDGQLFEFNSRDMQATFKRLSSGEMVKKDRWYHIVVGIPVECTDPNHHEVEIPG